MRLFPRDARHRLLAATAACSLAIGALAVPLAHADDHLKHQRNHVQHRIHSASHDLDESSARLRRTTGALHQAKANFVHAKNQLTVARSKLAAARVRDHEMQVALDTAIDRLATARSELATGKQELEAQHVQVTGTITSIYEQGDPELLAFASLLDANSPADLTRRMEARNVIVGRETRAYDDLHAAEVLLEVRENEVESAKDDVAAQRRAAAEHLVTMKDLHAQTAAARTRVREVLLDRRDAWHAAADARHKDRAQLVRLKQRENRIRQRILAAARHARGGYQGRTGGFLNHPVNGPVTSPFGYREHPIYHYWGLHDGDDFGAGCGQPLYAVSGGTVMSEYYSSVWGNRLYLNLGTVNGKNLTVIYNHLSRYRVGRGQHVGRGEVVGYVGTTGWSTGCHLHFTVMVNGTPVNPMNWF